MKCHKCGSVTVQADDFCRNCGAKNAENKGASAVAEVKQVIRNGIVGEPNKSKLQLYFWPLILICIYSLINGLTNLSLPNNTVLVVVASVCLVLGSLAGLIFLIYLRIRQARPKTKLTFPELIKTFIGISPASCGNCQQEFVSSDSFCRNCGVARAKTTSHMIIARSLFLAALVLLILSALVALIELLLIYIQLTSSLQISVSLITGFAACTGLAVFFVFINFVVDLFRLEE